MNKVRWLIRADASHYTAGMENDPLALTKNMAGTLGLDLSPGALIAGFVFSVIGYYLYREGKKRLNRGVLWTGVVMMIYPVFISGATRLWVAGAGLCAVAYFFWTRDESL